MNRAVLERLVKSWRTSSVGVAGTGVALYLFNTLGCRWPESGEWVVTIIPAVIGILTKEREAAK